MRLQPFKSVLYLGIGLQFGIFYVCVMSVREQGQVKWFNNAKGFGFIQRVTGEDVFVHFRSIVGDGYRSLRDGEMVEFVVTEGNKGLQAEEVTKL